MVFVPQASRVRFILVEPSHPGNIGAACRAINTMGFNRLYVVNPRDTQYKSNADAISLCTHSTDVLANSVMTDTLEQALEGVNFALALSGYDREFGPPMCSVIEACEQARELTDKDEQAEVAFVFGTERSGLTNEQLLMCQRCVGIPANPECDSLNLAQAVQVTAYQAQLALRGETLTAHSHRFKDEIPAEVTSVEKMYSHLEQALIACGALNPDRPKLMMERMRHLFGRCDLTQKEVDLLRGIFSAVIQSKVDRKGQKKPISS